MELGSKVLLLAIVWIACLIEQSMCQSRPQELSNVMNAINLLARALDDLKTTQVSISRRVDVIEDNQRQIQQAFIFSNRLGQYPSAPSNLLPGLYPSTGTSSLSPPSGFLGTQLGIPSGFIERKTCALGFENIGSECYYLSVRDMKKLNWQEASDSCTNKNAKLASINTSASLKLLSDYLATYVARAAERFWVNALNLGSDWRWVESGQPVLLNTAQWTLSTTNRFQGARSWADTTDDLHRTAGDQHEENIANGLAPNGVYFRPDYAADAVLFESTDNIGGNLFYQADLGLNEQNSVKERKSTYSGETTSPSTGGPVTTEFVPIVSEPAKVVFVANVSNAAEDVVPASNTSSGNSSLRLLKRLSDDINDSNVSVATQERRPGTTAHQFRNRRQSLLPTRDSPWKANFGRCLELHVTEDKRAYKYAADQCAFNQYYICKQNT